MKNPTIEVTSEERDYDKYFKIDKAIITETSESGEITTYNRFKLTRPDAVAVIIYNSDDDTVVLIKQHRYPTHGKVNGDIYEIVAGKMDEGEDHKQTAIREVEEEVGYKIQEDKLIYKSSFFASPGYSSEIIHLYAASVTNADKVSNGGGLQGEHENIEIFHVPAPEFFNMFVTGEIIDAKSIIGANALWHLRNDDRVKVGLQYYEQLRLDNARKIADQVINDPEAQDNADETIG
jgi:ADP-ribose pyrophosphatase